MTRADLLALAERVEQATGPSFALECDIHEALGRDMRVRMPAYTESIDAAASLVPEGWRVLAAGQPDVWQASMAGPQDEVVTAEAVTEPLARTAAALRATAAMMGDDA